MEQGVLGMALMQQTWEYENDGLLPDLLSKISQLQLHLIVEIFSLKEG